MTTKVWNLMYHLGNTGRVIGDAQNPQSRASALEGAAVIEKNGWRVWVEHHKTGKRVFESAKEAQANGSTLVQSPATLRLSVIDKDSVVLGTVACAVGMLTYAGKVTRFTDKTVWTMPKSGIEQMHRVFDGRLPSVYKSRLPAGADVQWKKEA